MTLSIILLYGCSDSPTAPRGPPSELASKPAPPPAYSLKPLLAKKGKVYADQAQESDTLGFTGSYTVIVGATWCPFTEKMLEVCENLPASDRPAAVFYYDDENQALAKRLGDPAYAEKEGLTAADAAALRKQLLKLDKAGQPFTDSGIITRHTLKAYLVQSGTFEALVTGFPSEVTCDPTGCHRSGKFTNLFNAALAADGG